ncbi:hypothetical protein Tco_0558941 [Tanacetum coccineum]
MTKVTDVEANLEQFKIEHAAINSEAAKQLALLQAKIEKNKICLSPNNMTYFEEDEKEFENTRSVKEDKDEQGKEEKGVVNSFEVGTDEENNSDIVLNGLTGNVPSAVRGCKLRIICALIGLVEDGLVHSENVGSGRGGMWNPTLVDKVFLGAGIDENLFHSSLLIF